jgi:excinuclease UvrABC ATPase subunit
MCPRCEGRGTASDVDLGQLFDETKSLAEGAITVPGYTPGGWNYRLYASSGFYDPNKPIREYTEQERHDFLYREPVRMKIEGINMTYEGLVPRIQGSYLSKDQESLQPHIRAFVDRAVTFTTCPACGGTRLAEGARSSRIRGISIADACAMQISDLAAWIRDLDEPSVAPLLGALRHLLDSFVEIGLGYLSLERSSGTLSGGEAQRVKMIRHIGSSLTDVTYVFDEPTTGLHPHDVQRMNALLRQLRDKGNTVLVVEHEPEVIVTADHVIDLGPGAGTAGGQVVFEGTVEGLRASDTLTGRHLGYRAGLKPRTRAVSGRLEFRHANQHNLQDVSVNVPLGVLVVVTGVAGSGKSSLIHGSMPRDAEVASIDQAPIKGSRRSNPATYTGLLDPIRTAFARANGARSATATASSTRSSDSWKPSSRSATSAGGSDSRPASWSTRSTAGTSARCSRCRSPKRWRSSAAAPPGRRPPRRSLPGWPTWVSAISRSGSRSPRSPAASGSGSGWRSRWPPTAASTCSTNRPRASTSPTSNTCSPCSTGWSRRASR